MAISPPSDILLDVARAADPAQVRDATARLARLAADPAAANDGFTKALAAAKAVGGSTAAAAKPAAADTAVSVPSASASVRRAAHPPSSTYRKFEAAMLQNFIEAMLPKDDATFGDANTASIYRTMMAEQLADQIAAAGGIGIAKAVEKAHPLSQGGQPSRHSTIKPT